MARIAVVPEAADSLKRQRAAVHAFAKSAGYEIVEEFYDAAVSGAAARIEGGETAAATNGRRAKPGLKYLPVVCNSYNLSSGSTLAKHGHPSGRRNISANETLLHVSRDPAQ
jgi:hypothetical protein